MEPAQQDRTPFSDLDRMPPEMLRLLIGALHAMGHHPEIRKVRGVAWEALRPSPGQRLLEAGCGGGDVARQLAAAVAPDGEVLAVDFSAATLAAARARHDGSPVRYRLGDVCRLDLPDDAFDGVRCERVLQHVADPDAAIGEFLRVTRPGGRVCLIDTDWHSLAFDGVPAALAGTVAAGMQGRFIFDHGAMGRTLRRRLSRAGARDVWADPVTCLFATPQSAAVVLPMVNPLVPADVWPTSPGERDAWFAAVDAAGVRGDFLAVLTIWVVTGTA
jgi:SAM-dependent methyltransferase